MSNEGCVAAAMSQLTHCFVRVYSVLAKHAEISCNDMTWTSQSKEHLQYFDNFLLNIDGTAITKSGIICSPGFV